MIQRKQNRYDLMSTQLEDDTTCFPDCLSIDLEKLKETRPPLEVLLTSNYVVRPDIFFFEILGTNNLEDIILWCNGIASRRDMQAGELLKIPFSGDLTSYYLADRKMV